MVVGLSKSKVAEYTDVFNTFDTDASGSVSASNLHAILLYLGFEHVSREDAISLLKTKHIAETGEEYTRVEE
jgi:Ca2+-binding EF-hand superfamily protein